MEFVVAIPAGPSDEDAARTHDLIEALRAHEPRTGRIVVVDGAAEARVWPDGVDAIAGPPLAALRWAHEAAPGAWVLWLTADARVTGPFADAVDAAWRQTDGILGAWEATRDLAKTVRRHRRRVWLWRRPPWRGTPFVRQLIREALVRGYEPGVHCTAPACAISAEMVGRVARDGWLANPEVWRQTRLRDDVVLGIMARALWLDLRDFHVPVASR